jgi:transketolase
MIKLVENIAPDKQEMRQAYCEALINTARNDPRIMILDCDLSNSLGTKAFYKEFPERAFNLGIQEANACSMAAGLSVTGMIPFVHTFAVFSSRRMLDQLFISCAYAGRNVKLIGGDAGVSAATNGGTHMAFEDIGIIRTIPNVTIIEPSDPVMMKSVVPQMAKHYGVDYLRMPRKKVMRIYEDGSSFTIGKAALLREGNDVTLIASGMLVSEALKAAQILAEEGIQARVVDMFTIKPIDAECIIDSAEKTGAIVTAENHNIINALGSAVAEVLIENCPVPMERVGVRDMFGEVGTQEDLMQRFNLTAEEIVLKAKKAINRK